MVNNIGNVQRLVPGLVEKLGSVKPSIESSPETKESNFTEIFSNMLNSVNGSQQDSAAIQQALLSGDPVELHEVMIKAEEAGLSMDLLLEVRNKLINAYNEFMRMPI
ncbi:MAG: flagellar hook-basal body complex protein FliE [candidate division Zixibacteria bacterium]|nr:flagellar hook-basal body complex protein FliE [candidate division Zixibacteria bacterium]RKX22345.1 MAG: flagellar hook-basal body complex protein FliE [candidate division Zixibacteria bacterium]